MHNFLAYLRGFILPTEHHMLENWVHGSSAEICFMDVVENPTCLDVTIELHINSFL